ncbi:hypothetical protein DLREEDagrD3_11140 [Denitratisoma sp. agr-D3]
MSVTIPSWRGAAPLAALLLGACATPTAPPPVVADAAPVEAEEPKWESQPLKHLLGRNLKPMAEMPINAKTKCSFRDPTGYRGQLALKVKNTTVEQLTASVTIPKRGSCSFDLKDFRQTASGASAVLSHKASECTLRLWTQGRQLTVGFNNCPQQCSGESFDYLWPILVDAKSGRCS